MTPIGVNILLPNTYRIKKCASLPHRMYDKFPPDFLTSPRLVWTKTLAGITSVLWRWIIQVWFSASFLASIATKGSLAEKTADYITMANIFNEQSICLSFYCLFASNDSAENSCPATRKAGSSQQQRNKSQPRVTPVGKKLQRAVLLEINWGMILKACMDEGSFANYYNWEELLSG